MTPELPLVSRLKDEVNAHHEYTDEQRHEILGSKTASLIVSDAKSRGLIEQN